MNVLKNKFYKSYDKLSRYASFPCYYNTLDDKYVTGTTTPVISNEYSVYEVKDGETYDLIALRAYNNPTYYWIICDFNNVFDVFINPLPGTRLKIPVLSNVDFAY